MMSKQFPTPRMRGFLCTLAILIAPIVGPFAVFQPVFAQPAATASAPRSGFQLREFQDAAGSHKYSIFVPKNYTPASQWPLILFLHGAGERGTDGLLQTNVGLGPLIKAREANFPFIVVFPQNEDVRGRILTGWSPDGPEGKRALAIVGQVEADFNIDTKKEILTGWSMGGYGAWQMAAANPARWAAVVPVSGGGDPALAEKIGKLPVWSFHGAKDALVSPEGSRKLQAALLAIDAKSRYTESPNGDHNAWLQAYDDDRLYAWMLNPAGDPDQLPPVTSRPAATKNQLLSVLPEPPFIPAVEIPQAVTVRMGNEMLAAVAETIPQVVPRDMLSGNIADISEYTTAEGYGFSVYVSGIRYSAQLAGARVKAYQKDRLNIQLGLSNAQVVFGGTSISGERHSASAGPISAVIGHRAPVWLSVDVTPVVVNRKLKLKLVAAAFQIPNDNWYVTNPAGVSASGFGLTREKVASALVSGVYGKKGTIEREVAAIAPKLLLQLEEKLDFAQFSSSSANVVWPLPAYQPRMKFWPGDVSTDEQGVSLVLGLTAAALDTAKPPQALRVMPPAGPPALQLSKSNQLQIGLAPQAISPLTDLLIQADVARIHLADTPVATLAKLEDPQTLAEIIPDLKRYGNSLQVSAELVLAGPVNVQDIPPVTSPPDAAPASASPEKPATVSPARRFAIDFPQLKVVIAIKPDAAATQWTPCAEFDVALRQPATPLLMKPTQATRAIGIEWNDSAQIEVKGKFSAGYSAQDQTLGTEAVKSHLQRGWSDYLQRGTGAQMEIADIDLGYAKLRLNDATWSAPLFLATFTPPGVKITNSSALPLVYETKGPYSNWGGPFTLPPGGVHDFPITYPMLFRQRVGNDIQMFTLPVGSHTEYRSNPAGTPPRMIQAREPAEIEQAKADTSAAAASATDSKPAAESKD